MSKKLSIKPIHLVFIGLAIIVLGILIPSFFINPFSAIGFSAIIGSAILLSAYALFVVNLVKLKGKKAIKWLFIPVILAVLAAGGLYAYITYNQSLVDKIYSAGDVVRYPDFTLEITKAEVKPVNLPINQDAASKFGGLEKREDCSVLSDIDKPRVVGIVDSTTSDRVMCVRRNNSRDEIQKYSEANRQLVIDYKIVADTSVESSGIKVELLPDSGRDIKERVSSFNGSEFMDDNDNFDNPYIYLPMVKYIPYNQSDIGGNISKGITRTAYMYTDVRTSEQTADFILTYTHNGTTEKRTVRINLKD